MPLLRFGGAQIDVWSANFLFGTELEMKGGWALFGLDLERGAGMVWEQLTCNFSVGSGMYAMLCDGMGGGDGSRLWPSVEFCPKHCKRWLRVWDRTETTWVSISSTAMAQATLAGHVG